MLSSVVIDKRPTFAQQPFSIDLDGGDEHFRNATEQTIGIANEWSVSAWVKPDSGEGGSAYIADITPATGNDSRFIGIWQASSSNINFFLGDGDGSSQTAATWNDDDLVLDDWNHLLFVWDGTTRSLWVNGIDQGAPDSGSATPGFTLDDDDRIVVVGNNRILNGTLGWNGRYHSLAIWRADVSSALSAIYNGGNPGPVDLNNIAFSGDLAHWWRLGHQVSPNLGRDYAEAGFTQLIDIETDAVDVDDSDRVADVP